MRSRSQLKTTGLSKDSAGDCLKWLGGSTPKSSLKTKGAPATFANMQARLQRLFKIPTYLSCAISNGLENILLCLGMSTLPCFRQQKRNRFVKIKFSLHHTAEVWVRSIRHAKFLAS